MNENDIEGEEEGISGMDGEVKITPFNMKEELEEGHFDREGHFQWNKDKEIKDNWLDNIDWVKVCSFIVSKDLQSTSNFFLNRLKPTKNTSKRRIADWPTQAIPKATNLANVSMRSKPTNK